MRELLEPLLQGTGPVVSLLALLGAGAAVLLVAGRLARDADTIAEETKLGGLWIGSLLLAAATSLPELLTEINAGVLGVPDIGAGDLLGSSMANMAILALANLVFLSKRIFHHADTRHALVALLAIVMSAVLGFGIAVRGLPLGPIGADSLLVLVIYLGGMWLLRKIVPVHEGAESGGSLRSRRLWLAYVGFAVATALLLALAPALVVTAEVFAGESGLTQGFVGTLLVGAMTSFPELAATLIAVRMGSHDLAVGGILGSNVFNLTFVFAMDLFYAGGPVTGAISMDHLPTVFFATAMTALGGIAILYRNRQPRGVARFESFLLLGIYALGMAFLAARQGGGPAAGE